MKKKWKVFDSDTKKAVVGPKFHHIFDKVNGTAMTWGETVDDDPQYCPVGPLIADIEISTICHQGCPQCYKSNTTQGHNMSLETVQQVLDKLPNTVGQIAYGIGSIDSHPQLFDILNYTRSKGIIPNLTVNGYRMTADIYQQLTKVLGAVAVSRYDKDTCYHTVHAFNSWKKELGNQATLKQVNIHQILCQDSLDQCFQLLKDVQIDKRLEDLNAVVFLLLKPKGKRNTLTQLKDSKKFKELIDYALDNNLPVGFDSCSQRNFIQAVKDRENYQQLKDCSEECESSAFSAYVSADAKFYPCSFCEGVSGWEDGLNILEADSFLKDVWFHPRTVKFRNTLMKKVRCKKNCTSCPIFDLDIA